MPTIEDSIQVQVPIQQAYNQWTQFEEFPKFMEGIQSVQQLDDTHVRWIAEIRGESRRWTTEITEQQPDGKIAWKTIDGEVKNDGVVTFERVGDGQTRVNVRIDVEGESSVENVAGDLLGIVKGQVHGDLERFKQLIENRKQETGAWRGAVHDGEVRVRAHAREGKEGSVATEQGQERRETAEGAGAKAQEVVSQAKEQVHEKAGQVKGTAMDRLRGQLDSQSTRLGEQVTPFAQALRESGTHLGEEGQSQGAQAAHSAADQAERLAGYLKESDSNRILGDVEDFARRRPWLTGAIGLAIGFVAARFVKATADRDGTRTTLSGMTPPAAVRGEGYARTPLAPPVSPEVGL
jgi:ElaB/YqjD/DUF883 family membrane-anchored ribosome-binding protein/ribosome-associated toxin RatA of RatAB toxin-antitoxin module